MSLFSISKNTKHYFDNNCKIDKYHDMKLEIDLLHKLYFDEEDENG